MISDLNFPNILSNYGGIWKFYFIPVEDVLSQQGNIIKLKEGKRWFIGRSSKDKIEFKQNQNNSRNGTTYKPTLDGELPKITPELEEKLTEMSGREFLVVYHDLNNYRWLVGNMESPLLFSADLETGNRPSSRNYYPFTFQSPLTRERIYPFNGEITTEEPTEPGQAPCLPVTIKNILGETIYLAQPGSTIQLDTDFGQDFIDIT